MASPAFRTAGSLLEVASAPTSSGSVSLPAGVTNGDFLLLTIRTYSAATTPTPPGGWAPITSHALTSITQSDLQLYYRTASSEPSTYSVSCTGSPTDTNGFAAQILAWDSGTFDASATFAATSGSTTIPCPSVIAAAGNSTLICIYGQYGSGASGPPYTAPSGMTERVDVSSGGQTSWSVADLALASSGATGTKNATATSSSPWHLAVSLVIAGSTTGPTINTQPSNASVTAPATATFTVAATASAGSLSYQWQEDDGGGWANVSDGGAYSGATLATLTIDPTSIGMTGYQYRCNVSDSNGTTNSNAATLTVAAAALSVTLDAMVDEFGNPRAAYTVDKVWAIRVSDNTLVATWTAQTTNGGGVLPALSDAALTAVPHEFVTYTATGLKSGAKVYTPA